MIKNLSIAVGGVIIIALVVWAASTYMKPAVSTPSTSSGQATTGQTGVKPGTTTEIPPVVYQCKDSKSMSAVFTEGNAMLSLSDGRTNIHMLRTNVPNDTGTEVKFVSDDGKTVLWVQDFSAFVEEGGTTTYAGCTVSPNTYQ